MNTLIQLLRDHPKVSGYKINTTNKESCELFFVKGKLETVRRTDTCDQEVTVYVDHDGCKGDAQFFIYPSTTTDQIATNIDKAVSKALLISNPHYTLPAAETGSYQVESNFEGAELLTLAEAVSQAVFAAKGDAGAALNSVEVFINRYTERILNSNGLDKTQTRYTAMVEAIPTYNGSKESVELYQQYNFSTLDATRITREVEEKLREVKARYEAVKPDFPMDCNVVLNKQELAQLFMNIAYDLHYSSVYTHSNLWNKGDAIQKAPVGDAIGIRMAGEAPGSVRSAKFDSDGLSLTETRIVDGGRAVNYFGDNRYGQYLGENPTGDLRCICADAGTLESCIDGTCLEIISMSGLQVDAFNDYIGGEIRLAYYHSGEKTIPVTGISVSGKLGEVLDQIRFSAATTACNSYTGPEQAVLRSMKIF